MRLALPCLLRRRSLCRPAAAVLLACGRAGTRLSPIPTARCPCLPAPLQASLQLRQYRALEPQYAQLAREHAAVLEQLEETEFELREIEQFRQLARVTG